MSSTKMEGARRRVRMRRGAQRGDEGEGGGGNRRGRGTGRKAFEELIEPRQIVDMTLMEVGQKVQPDLSRKIVASVI